MTANLIQLIQSANIEVDSLKIKIPLHKVKDINPELIEQLELSNPNTGELKALYAPRYNPNVYGVSQFKIEKQSYFSKPRKTMVISKYLTFGINSKILLGNYFNGLSKDHSKHIYDCLMSLGAGEFSYDDLLQGECTDIDLKFDFDDIGGMTFDEFTKQVKQVSLYPEITNRFAQRSNKGIEISKRSTLKYEKTPFIKFYYKKGELLTNSVEFYNDYLKDKISIDEIPLYRCETTLKNKKHLSRFEVDNMFNSILVMTMEKKREVVKKALNKNLGIEIEKKERIKGKSLKALFIQFLGDFMRTDEAKKYIGNKYNGGKLFEIFCVQYSIENTEKTTVKSKLKNDLKKLGFI